MYLCSIMRFGIHSYGFVWFKVQDYPIVMFVASDSVCTSYLILRIRMGAGAVPGAEGNNRENVAPNHLEVKKITENSA